MLLVGKSLPRRPEPQESNIFIAGEVQKAKCEKPGPLSRKNFFQRGKPQKSVLMIARAIGFSGRSCHQSAIWKRRAHTSTPVHRSPVVARLQQLVAHAPAHRSGFRTGSIVVAKNYR